MQRSGIRDRRPVLASSPDSAALHPGYGLQAIPASFYIGLNRTPAEPHN
jgi:hypothetical protein